MCNLRVIFALCLLKISQLQGTLPPDPHQGALPTDPCLSRLGRICSPTHEKCMYCGWDQHARDTCPARSATFRACSKQGHYAMVCRSGKEPNHKTVHQVSDIESKEDRTAHFLGSVDQDFQFDNCWTATLSIDRHPTVFKLDTAASVSVISSSEL